MKRAVFLSIAVFVANYTAPAFADPLTPEEPQFVLCEKVSLHAWGDPKEIEMQVQDLGYEPISTRIEKGCWEVKAINARQDVFEFYIHPATKDVVMQKQKPNSEYEPRK